MKQNSILFSRSEHFCMRQWQRDLDERLLADILNIIPITEYQTHICIVVSHQFVHHSITQRKGICTTQLAKDEYLIIVYNRKRLITNYKHPTRNLYEIFQAHRYQKIILLTT